MTEEKKELIEMLRKTVNTLGRSINGKLKRGEKLEKNILENYQNLIDKYMIILGLPTQIIKNIKENKIADEPIINEKIKDEDLINN